MAKPVLLVVDDEPEVLRAIERDLRAKYNQRYRILRADSGKVALEVLHKLKLRNQPVALLLSDQRMPQMTGVEFFEQTLGLFQKAKRVLLTAYADTEAAIRAINIVKIDYYLLKPWDPPEEKLYPVLSDLLDDWHASFRPAFEGIRVIGPRWSPRSHQTKDFLGRHQIPYQWLDIAENEEANRLVACTKLSAPHLPLVLFPDGSHLENPTNLQIADKIGLKTQAKLPFYDLIIVGAGPAGLAAAVYGASEGLNTVVIEHKAPGGQAGSSSRIENYLGFPIGLSGEDLTRRAVAQAKRFGVELLTPQEAVGVSIEDSYRIVMLADGSELSCHALIVATGVSYRQLNVPGAEQLCGAGIYYGAAKAEAISCVGEEVFIIGGANSAGQAAIYFSQYASRVTMLVRSDSLSKKMSRYLVDQIEETPNVVVRLQTRVVEIQGENNLEAIRIVSDKTGVIETLPAKAVFIFIGAVPKTNWLEKVVQRDKQGFILTGPDLKCNLRCLRSWMLEREPFLLETNVPGIFAVGDVRYHSVKRVASAVGEGAISVQFVHQYLREV